MLRVGYTPDALPFAFFNARGDLVGFDVELAHHLAPGARRAAGVRAGRSRQRSRQQLGAGYCDIVMSGVAVTTLRAATMLFSNSYLDETFALVVPDYAREQFSSWSAIRGPAGDDDRRAERALLHRQAAGKAAASPADASWTTSGPRSRSPIRRWTPSPSRPSGDRPGRSCIPQFTVVVPEPGIVKVPLAYPIARHDDAFASFINTWIDLKRKDGTIETLYNYWVLGPGRGAAAATLVDHPRRPALGGLTSPRPPTVAAVPYCVAAARRDWISRGPSQNVQPLVAVRRASCGRSRRRSASTWRSASLISSARLTPSL